VIGVNHDTTEKILSSFATAAGERARGGKTYTTTGAAPLRKTAEIFSD